MLPCLVIYFCITNHPKLRAIWQYWSYLGAHQFWESGICKEHSEWGQLVSISWRLDLIFEGTMVQSDVVTGGGTLPRACSLPFLVVRAGCSWVLSWLWRLEYLYVSPPHNFSGRASLDFLTWTLSSKHEHLRETRSCVVLYVPDSAVI